MRLSAGVLFLSMATVLFGQAPADQAPTDQPTTGESKPQAERGAALEVTPGSPVIKQKDIYRETGYFHPFVRMPKYVLQDQKAIWTSPFHTSHKDLKYWAIFGGATAAFIATDQYLDKHLSNSPTQISISTWGSRFGSAYSLIPLSAGFYLIGTAAGNQRFRETGLIDFEALIDATVTVEALKFITNRARPTESNGKGYFGDSPNGRLASSFPSGHAINTWAMASVLAHQYPHPRIIPILAYGLSTLLIAARVGADKHFPGDVVAGSVMGWFIGDYVYGKRHNGELDHKTISQRILDHVHIGFAME